MMPRLQKPWHEFIMSFVPAFSIWSAVTFKPSSMTDNADPTIASAKNSILGELAQTGNETTPKKTMKP